jgi:hypothetical protein
MGFMTGMGAVALFACLSFAPIEATKAAEMDKTYKGKSTRLNGGTASFDEALQRAIDKARADTKGASIIKWKLIEVSGVRGGITAEDTIEVTVQASVP